MVRLATVEGSSNDILIDGDGNKYLVVKGVVTNYSKPIDIYLI